jgi:transposase
MFIRKSPIKSKKTGGSYYSYRLVESVRVEGKVKQKTLLNLGKHFDIDSAHWALLANRIDHLLQSNGTESQQNLFEAEHSLTRDLEAAAQRYAALLLRKLSVPVPDSDAVENSPAADYQAVDVNQIKVLKPRSMGAETLALHAFKQLKLDDKLRQLGFNEKDLSAAMGTIIGRMVHPGSERETHRWLQQNSALDELIDQDFGQLSLDRLYKVADKLLNNKKEIESHLGRREQHIFNLQRTIILYDLTNTYFEGQANNNSKAVRGRSKEKRSDCPLVTMGLVLDGDGFPLGSEIFDGNASEPKTLQTMLNGLSGISSPQGATVVLDAGIASQENLDWLKENNYHYIVVSREKFKQKPDLDQGAVVVKPTLNDQVIAQRVEDTDTGEIRLYCHSQKREAKDQAIRNQFNLRYEAKLKTLHDGLSKKGTIKKYEKTLERLGRLKEKYARVSQDYKIVVSTDDEKNNATEIAWTRQNSAKIKDDNAGVYCLRTDVDTLTEKELWQTYVMLTEVEASFKSMKSELGLRPIYHQKEERVTAHLFITLLAYHLVHTLRTQLKHKAINLSWQSIRNIMASQQRITVSMPTADRQQIYLRTTTKLEPAQQSFFTALDIKSDALGPRKTTIEKD